MRHPLSEMIEKRKSDKSIGIPSYCTANEMVLETILVRAKETGNPVLIEATANQVNQFGGYTGMKPQDFRDYISRIAQEHGVDEKLIILGGDHLGPLTWMKDSEAVAMKKSRELVRDYILAGFTKIHLDTSMKLADDAKDKILSKEVIARRGVILYKECMAAYAELQKKNPEAMRPVFIIGSEVPIPGGTQEAEESIEVTKADDFLETVAVYQQEFARLGVADGFADVIAVVVQPGVEFGDAQVFAYDSAKAANLCATLKKYPEMVFEGHSTDYQTPIDLRQMTEDGIAILKVGPALTFQLREALFALSFIEKELVEKEKQTNLIEILDEVMMDNPDNWQNHYQGNVIEQAVARKYSFSDRCRYYMGDEKVKDAIDKLGYGLLDQEIPNSLLRQFMPRESQILLETGGKVTPRRLIQMHIEQVLDEYEYATGKDVLKPFI
jgi:Predicted tagatose 6-phosphate kinase